jgi:hypothetical protein
MTSFEGFLVVQKVGANLAIITEMFGVRFGPTRDEVYVHAVAVEEARRDAAAREQALAAFWSDPLELSELDAVTNAVLELHAPDTDAWNRSLICHVCDATELDPGPWPCRTVVAIAGAYSIEVPQ